MYTLNVQYPLLPDKSKAVTVTAVVPTWNVPPVGMLYTSAMLSPLYCLSLGQVDHSSR